MNFCSVWQHHKVSEIPEGCTLIGSKWVFEIVFTMRNWLLWATVKYLDWT